MKISIKRKLQDLKSTMVFFDPVSNSRKQFLLQEMLNVRWVPDQDLVLFYDLLLYLLAYPDSFTTHQLAEKNLTLISSMLGKKQNRYHLKLENTGLPFTKTITRFSHEHLLWMNQRPGFSLSIDSFDCDDSQFSNALRVTLPTLEKDKANAGYSKDELFDALNVKPGEQLSFLLNEFNVLKAVPFAKDQLFESLLLNVSVFASGDAFSRGKNRFPVAAVYCHEGLLKSVDHNKLLNTKVPASGKLDEKEKEQLSCVIKNSLTLTARETDPSTFMDSTSLRLYELGRGISIALYGMIPERQLPLESYIGYTLFKNGLPAAYGGSWIFGDRALFGINIFEPYRGGESGYILCQLLRTYRQVFKVNYFEVESYQYGGGNPEGIASGAFWFYYRFGFRPLRKDLDILARTEFEKMKVNKQYRSSEKTLLRFTEESIGLNMGDNVPLAVSAFTANISSFIQKRFHGDRRLAEIECVKKVSALLPQRKSLSGQEAKVFTEFALVFEANKITDTAKVSLLRKMAKAKVSDVYSYQKLLIEFLKK
jgi:hypothetical protein